MTSTARARLLDRAPARRLAVAVCAMALITGVAGTGGAAEVAPVAVFQGGVEDTRFAALWGGGDANGDGHGDLLVVPEGRTPGGAAYVVFGGRPLEQSDVRRLTAEGAGGGFRIEGGSVDGEPVVIWPLADFLGDVNGDGLDDVALAVPGAGGGIYIVYGSASGHPVVLSDLGDRGFRVDGFGSVKGVGDVNGDGGADVAVTSRDLEVIVLHSESRSSSLWWTLRGEPPESDEAPSGLEMDGVGDVNGDGRGDLAVLDFAVDRALVVFMADEPQPGVTRLAELGDRGFEIGQNLSLFPGFSSVAGVGDVNGDGVGDIAVTDGNTLVVFGKSDAAAVDLATQGWGFTIRSARGCVLEHPFATVALGDVNGDGLGDLAMTGFTEDRLAVVYGKADGAPVMPSVVPGPEGFLIDVPLDERTTFSAFQTIAAVGDVDSDGRPDLAAGTLGYFGQDSPFADRVAVFSSAPPPTPPTGVPPAAHPPRDAAFDGDAATTERLQTPTPYSREIRVQGRLVPCGAEHVVLARAGVFADALAGASLAGRGLLLFAGFSDAGELTGTQDLPRYLPEGGTVYLLGGEAALPAEAEEQIAEAGFRPVRLAGATRVETAVAVAEEARRLYGADDVLLARAYGAPGNETAAWADAVAGGAWAAWSGTPLLLTPKEGLDPAVAAALDQWAPDRTILLGGSAALSRAVEAAAPNPLRVAGEDRAGTAAAVAARLWPPGRDRYVVVNGCREDGWAFGLGAAGQAADTHAPVLLTAHDELPDATLRTVSRCAGGPTVDLLLVGDDTVISEAVADRLDAADGPACPP